MNPVSSRTPCDEERLGQLAMRFRGARRDEDRRAVSVDYGQTVARLIAAGDWREAPAPEDQLPDAWMPEAFFEYWKAAGGDDPGDKIEG